MSKELLLAARPVFGDVFFPTYGMAETYSCGLLLRPENQRPDGDEDDVRRLGSAGKPHLLVDVRVVGDDGRDGPRDGQPIGEVLVRGDAVAAATSVCRRRRHSPSPADGCTPATSARSTGDGYITIVDRMKDIIISGGINVHSREVEEVLLRHPAVGQAAVIGVPHPQWGEAVHAVVVAVPGARRSRRRPRVLRRAAGELQEAEVDRGARPAPDQRHRQGAQAGAAGAVLGGERSRLSRQRALPPRGRRALCDDCSHGQRHCLPRLPQGSPPAPRSGRASCSWPSSWSPPSPT